MIRDFLGILAAAMSFLGGLLLLVIVLPATVGAILILGIILLDPFLWWFFRKPILHDVSWWIYPLALVLLPIVSWFSVKLHKVLGID